MHSREARSRGSNRLRLNVPDDNRSPGRKSGALAPKATSIAMASERSLVYWVDSRDLEQGPHDAVSQGTSAQRHRGIVAVARDGHCQKGRRETPPEDCGACQIFSQAALARLRIPPRLPAAAGPCRLARSQRALWRPVPAVRAALLVGRGVALRMGRARILSWPVERRHVWAVLDPHPDRNDLELRDMTKRLAGLRTSESGHYS